MRLAALTLLTVLTACGNRESARDAPLIVDVVHDARGVVLTLRAHRGLKINALLPPQLEMADGSISRFPAASHQITPPDSAYFSEPPFLVVPSGSNLTGAQVRASVCDSGAAVCRVLTISL